MIDLLEPTRSYLTLADASGQNGDSGSPTGFAILLANHLAALLGSLRVATPVETPEMALPAVARPVDDSSGDDPEVGVDAAYPTEAHHTAASTPAGLEPTQESLLALVGCPVAVPGRLELTSPPAATSCDVLPDDSALAECATPLSRAAAKPASGGAPASTGWPASDTRPPATALPPGLGGSQAAVQNDDGTVTARTSSLAAHLETRGRREWERVETHPPARYSLDSSEDGAVTHPAASDSGRTGQQSLNDVAVPPRNAMSSPERPAYVAAAVASGPSPAPQVRLPEDQPTASLQQTGEEEAEDLPAASGESLPGTPAPVEWVDEAAPGRADTWPRTAAGTVAPSSREQGGDEVTLVTSPRLVAQGGEGEFSARLEPPTLGRLEVRVAVRDGALDVAFTCDQPATVQIVEAHLAELRSALEDQGVRLASLGVGHGELADVPSRFGERREQPDGRSHVRLARVEEVGLRLKQEGVGASRIRTGAKHHVDVLV